MFFCRLIPVILFAFVLLAGCNKRDLLVAEKNQLLLVVSYCDMYRDTYGTMPKSIDELKVVSSDVKHLDVWGNEIRLMLEDGVSTGKSAGPDGRFDTSDDIVVRGASKAKGTRKTNGTQLID